MNTFNLTDSKLASVLAAIIGTATFAKKAIVAIAQNTTGHDLTYSTVLKDGKVEVASAVCKAGDWIAVQPDGEVMLLASAKVPKLYEVEAPLDAASAASLAAERKLTITSEDQIKSGLAMLAEKNPGVDLSGVHFNWYTAKGRIAAFRAKLALPKPSWGADSVQEAELSHAIVYNLVAPGAYMIGKEELIANWVNEGDPSLEGAALWESLPVLIPEQFNAAIA